MTDIAREKLTQSDDEIEAAFEELGYGLTINNLCFGPCDEIDDIRAARKEWANPGRVTTDEADVLVIEGAQATRGQRRRDVAVIRFGHYCAIMGADMDKA